MCGKEIKISLKIDRKGDKSSSIAKGLPSVPTSLVPSPVLGKENNLENSRQ